MQTLLSKTIARPRINATLHLGVLERFLVNTTLLAQLQTTAAGHGSVVAKLDTVNDIFFRPLKILIPVVSSDKQGLDAC